MIQEKIKKVIISSLKKLGIDTKEVSLEHPTDLKYGDYSTNVALIYSKELKFKPSDLATKIVSEIEKNKPEEVARLEIAGPGFINFYLSQEFFANEIKKILKEKDKYGKSDVLKGKKVIVEYTDPNPFKEFHIGHLMSNTIGESISRIVEFRGANLKRACYQGDVGLHVATTIWGILQNKNKFGELMKKKLSEKVSFLGFCYAFGAQNREDEKIKKEIQDINKKVFDKSDKDINKIYDLGRKWSLEYFEDIYKKLGTKFDYYFFESNTGTFGKEVVTENIGKVFEDSEGAVVFKGENYGLHTRVFINSQGLPTYEAKELGLANIKYKKYKYDTSIVITGNEINDYFKVLLKAMSLVFPELASKTKHLSHGMLRLPTGKMSSRTGDVITAESLLGKIENLISEKIKDRELSQKEKKDISESVSIGSLKYSILKQAVGGDIIFDFDKSISFDGDSGPYLQYSGMRAVSVLKKAEVEKIKEKIVPSDIPDASELEKMIYRFGEVVDRAGEEYSPHFLATYLIELAGTFNGFYTKSKIVDKEDKNSPYKIALTHAFSIVMRNGLNLLGIKSPSKM